MISDFSIVRNSKMPLIRFGGICFMFHTKNENMKTKLIPAPIDEKNVTSDWIEDVFDDCVRNGDKFVGFIGECVVMCECRNYYIDWKVEQECFNRQTSKRMETFTELKKRLKNMDEEDQNIVVKYLPFGEGVTALTQQFYFRDED